MYENYTNYIKSFIDSDINSWNFKSNDYYRGILEHVSEKQGDEYLIEIMSRFPELYGENKAYLMQLANTNDSVGLPIKYSFYHFNFTTCSPTNLRYILHSFLILSFMKECNLSELDIIEIGGGYGGLCFYMYKLAHLFDISIKSYCIFDLAEPRLLQKKYIESFNIENENVQYLDMSEYENLQPNSFLISNYAFSEISHELQQQYSRTVLNYTSHGFLTWNFIPVYSFIENKKIDAVREYPLTSESNMYVRFSPL